MDDPHWQLFLVGVEPGHQGRGLGAAIVDEMTAKARLSGAPGYLDTLTSGNVAFYERRGYRVVGEADGLGVPAWGLRID
jgi:predicted N-acetyltransferase YhbS